MRVGEHDRTIVRHLYHYGLLSQSQIRRILERSRSTVQQLLRRLYDHRYVDTVTLPVTSFGSSPLLYVLDREGIALLRSMGIEDFAGLPDKNVKALFLRHMLAIGEVHLALEQACQQTGYTLNTWLNDQRLLSAANKARVARPQRAVALIPDSYFSITVPNLGTTHCFLEVDRGTKSGSDYAQKMAAYVQFYKSGEFSRRYDAQGFRVLTVVDGVGERRVANLVKATAQVPAIGRRFWFTHLKHITPSTVLSMPIWQIAGSDERVALVSS
jgi:DNA-binding MarR family transcriptional regulator